MATFPVFLSVVIVVKDQVHDLEPVLVQIATEVASLASDYELIMVDNGSEPSMVELYKSLTKVQGQPNLQIYALTKEVDDDTASWVGVENALGDFVVVIDPWIDDIKFLRTMLEKAVTGSDVVFANNQRKPKQGLAYRLSFAVFNRLYVLFNGINLSNEAPQYRVLSKTVINFILQHAQPAMSYRHLPATAGFSRANLSYAAEPKATRSKNLGSSIDRGMRLLVSTTRAPMRLVTSLSLFGAIANLVYSFYVVAIGLFKTDVAPGWISTSLQQSGMFFLISLVLLVLGEYILQMASLSNLQPPYHVAQEFTSVKITRREKLNVETVESTGLPVAPVAAAHVPVAHEARG
jgi:hypothetical protein